MRTIHILGLIALCGHHVQGQITPDCDLEFASSTLGIVQAYVNDPMKLANVEAILFSCNKSRMQKIAEISVFLLEKGTFPSRSMEDIRKVGLLINEEKKRRLDLFWEKMPPVLRKTTDDITLILLNNSLSGNEKVQSFTNTVAALPRDHRRALEEVFNQKAPQMHITPIAAKVESHHESADFDGDAEHSTMETLETLPSTPPPFPIEKEKETIPGTEMGVPASTVIRKSDLEHPSIPLDHGSSPQHLQPIRPANQRRSDPLNELFNAAMNVNADRKGTSRTSQGGSFNALFKPVPASTDEKPKSVGIVQKQTETIEMDDSDLLNPRSSLLSDAVRLLEKTIPLINPMRPPMLSKDSRFSPSQTFSVPGKLRNHPSDSIDALPLSERRTLLPSRDDPLHHDVAPIRPVNRAHSLGTFDTHLDRFASGVPNRVVLHADQLASIKDMDRLNAPPSRHLPPIPNYLTTRTEQFTIYPDHRKGLFPEVNQVRSLSQQARIFRPSSQDSAIYPANRTAGTPTNHVPTFNHDKTFLIENFPPAPYSIASRPKQMIGHDLLETDRLGSWSMGRFDKEEPNYPTPEPRKESTTVIAVLQERTTKASSDLSPLNEKPAVLPMFQRYQSPESITGSHALREVYNIRHHGRPRFVKIDLSNE